MPCTAAHMSNWARILFHATVCLGTSAHNNPVEPGTSVGLSCRGSGFELFHAQDPQMEYVHIFEKLALARRW